MLVINHYWQHFLNKYIQLSCLYEMFTKTKLLKKRSMWCLWFLDNLQLFNHIWKASQGIVFSMYQVFVYFPPSAIMATNWAHSIKKNCFIVLPYRQDNFIYLVKNFIIIDLLIFGMDFFQHSGQNIMPISCNASYGLVSVMTFLPVCSSPFWTMKIWEKSLILQSSRNRNFPKLRHFHPQDVRKVPCTLYDQLNSNRE